MASVAVLKAVFIPSDWRMSAGTSKAFARQA